MLYTGDFLTLLSLTSSRPWPIGTRFLYISKWQWLGYFENKWRLHANLLDHYVFKSICSYTAIRLSTGLCIYKHYVLCTTVFIVAFLGIGPANYMSNGRFIEDLMDKIINSIGLNARLNDISKLIQQYFWNILFNLSYRSKQV